MAKFAEMDIEHWNQWLAARPPEIQALCAKLPPNRLYLYKPTNSRVTIYSYCEDGTVTVDITGEYNHLLFERRVFGIQPEDLVECELPAIGEKLGCILNHVEASEYIGNMRDALAHENLPKGR